MRFLPVSILVVLSAVGPVTMSASGCGSSSGSTGGASSTTASTGTTPTTTATGATSGTGTPTSATTTATSGSTSTGGVMGMPESVNASQTPCFTLATGMADASNPCPGDLYFLTGVNVDLGAGAAGSPYCLPASGVPAPAASLSAVPTDYSTCMWTGYVEGGNGLANTGLIVRDAAAVHHYRMHITSNTLPNLVFEYAKID